MGHGVCHSDMLPTIVNSMNKSSQILFIFLLFTIPNYLFSQTPIISPQIHSFEDIQNSEYVGKIFSKLWIKSKVNRNKKWIESSIYFEFDKKGNIETKITEYFQNGTKISDTLKYDYNKNGFWETKIKSEKVISRKFHYNDESLLHSVTTSEAETITYEYFDNNNLAVIKYNDRSWRTFEYYSNNQLKSEKTYRDSSLYQIENYKYNSSSIKYSKMNIFSYAPNDTVTEVTTSYYNSDTSLTRVVTQIKDYDKWVYSITSMRYNEGLLITVTDCLTNESECGYADYLYDEKENLKNIISFTNDGQLKTRETVFRYEFRK
ncbi:MAG: hypothetical protein ACJARP_002759 [Vicingaceae bacterium]|jgi:hypothetical protein